MRKNLESLPERPEPTTITKHDDKSLAERAAERQLVFELWMGVAGRSIMRAWEIATNEPYNVAVKYETVRNWKHTYQWDIQADELQRQMSPALKGRFLGLAEAAAVEGMQEIRAALAGGRTLTGPEVQAIKLAVAAAGWLPDWKNAGAVQVQLAPSSGTGIGLTKEDRDALSSNVVELLALTDS